MKSVPSMASTVYLQLHSKLSSGIGARTAMASYQSEKSDISAQNCHQDRLHRQRYPNQRSHITFIRGLNILLRFLLDVQFERCSNPARSIPARNCSRVPSLYVLLSPLYLDP